MSTEIHPSGSCRESLGDRLAVGKRTVAWLILVLTVVFFFLRLDARIRKSLPYPGHPDERVRLEIAVRMLKTGDFNPHYFKKPSLGVYVTGVGLVAGYFRAAARGEISDVQDIGSVSYPYFSRPTIVYAAKRLFLFLAALSLLLLGIIGYKAYNLPFLISVPSLVLLFSERFVKLSSLYINVNILAVFLASVSLVYVFQNLHKRGFAHMALFPGILCGLCLSSKLNMVPIYLPFILVIVLFERDHLLLYTGGLFGVSVVTFLALNPYVLADLPTFLAHTGAELKHYAHDGHPGHSGPAGWPQFCFYVRSLVDQFGVFACLLSIVGIFHLLRTNWRSTMILFSLPLGMILLMSTQQVNFRRNIAVVYFLWPVFVASGALFLGQIVSRLMSARFDVPKAGLCKDSLPGVIGAVVLVFSLPLSSLVWNFAVTPDSRNLAVSWLRETIKEASTIVVPRDLNMDVRSLENVHKIRLVSNDAVLHGVLEQALEEERIWILVPEYGFDTRRPEDSKLADDLNRHFKLIDSRLKHLTRFGKNPVKVRQQHLTNPAISVARSM